jgi:hypothetical protein
MSAEQTVNPLMSSPQKDSGSLIKELWEHFYPKEFVATLFAYFKDHRKFFDEVLRGQWQGKLKPVPFYFTSFSIVLVVSLIFPFVNPFYMVDETTDLSGVNKFLTHELVTTALLAIFLMCYWFAAKVFHRCLNVPNRTQKETIYVYLYNSSAFILLNIPAAFFKSEEFVTSLAENNPTLILIFPALVFVVSIFSLIKTVMVFRYTHNVGFWRLLWAGSKTLLMIFGVTITLGIPLLFMSFEKNEGAKASRHRRQGILLGMAIIIAVIGLLYWADTAMENNSEPSETSVIAEPDALLEDNIGSDAAQSTPAQRIPASVMRDDNTEASSEPVEPPQEARGAARLEQKILGIWYFESEEEISDPEGTVTWRGTTEYFRNGTSTSVGEIIWNAFTPEGEKFATKYSFLSSGEWMIHQYALTEKLVDMKTTPEYFEMNGERDPERLAQMSKLEDEIPMGISEESEILEIGATMMRVKSRDSVGEEKIDVYYKRDKPFVLK